MRKAQTYKWNQMELGTCYYPEHWDSKLWGEDLRRMKENGIFTIRIAEFAWNKFEPQEGVFNFEFFDKFMEIAVDEGMKVILGTPTATPPVWLTEKYPEVLNCRMDGSPFYHGMRRHYNYNSKIYQELSARIVDKMAAHYGAHPAIIGWQIDNELNCEVDEFYSESDTLAFREFLKKKYLSLEKLNTAWGTIVWNQTYNAWEEIYVPRTTIHNSTNPHQTLDYIRFVSESAIAFCKMQSDIIRKYKKADDFITTNGMFGNLDNHKMQDQCLDVYTYDSYPNFAFCLEENPLNSDDLNDRKWSRNLMEVRSICPHFGIMEQQSGANGWNTRMEAPAPKPGQMMLWAMQSIAHGADYVSFFRWRTATVGTEIYWHGILDYDNRDNRKLTEVRQIWERTKAIGEMVGAEYQASVAMLQDYDNTWDSQVDVWHKRLKKQSEKEIFVAFQINHTPMDIFNITDETQWEELAKYSVLIYPHALILNEKKVHTLETYVQNGGILVLGSRTGQKDENGQCVMTPMPGLLASLTGTNVREYTFVGPADKAVTMVWGDKSVDTGVFNDILEVASPDAQVLAVYENNYYSGSSALIERKEGKGKVLHFGGTFTRENTKELMDYTGVLSPYASLIELPESCEIVVRKKDGVEYYIVLNFAAEEQVINLKSSLVDMDTKEEVAGKIMLQAYETRVFC
ncbi:beta-galactosidase [Ohessyouella blattaphilus]|uniref:Beta-galactosidase n=1 Tax=Ohessyouella blattaphilus TaxID=2949333 RepID=A0ABT1EIL1_9FIRM|nr:beta-galactosidase [Ohessyouella blattaphilus]MCP1110542.1 beta-galactosidase [Ohessyouella blattaphilus]MCR8563936.1 beta-galactosidase [Ohessyouella blattaphilus]